MKILCVCDQGNNRSVTLAHQLKYMGHDVLTCGLSTNSTETTLMLYGWADKIIVVDEHLLLAAKTLALIPGLDPRSKMSLWDIGPDIYPRPFNKQLLKKVRTLIDEHRDEL